MFLLRGKLITQGEKRETSTQNLQQKNVARQVTLRVFVSCISPSLDRRIHAKSHLISSGPILYNVTTCLYITKVIETWRWSFSPLPLSMPSCRWTVLVQLWKTLTAWTFNKSQYRVSISDYWNFHHKLPVIWRSSIILAKTLEYQGWTI